MDKGRYKMGTIAQETGFSPGLLRAWERRHKLLEPARGSGGHRLYTDKDMAVLKAVRVLMSEGRSIGEIAALGRPALLKHVAQLQRPRPAPDPAAHAQELPEPAPEFKEVIDRIVNAAAATQRVELEKCMEVSFGRWSAREVIYQIILPASKIIGQRWAQGSCSVAGEHLASSIFIHHLNKLLRASQAWNSASAQLLCCCFPDEQHELGILILAYEVACRGVSVTCFGQSLPFEDIESACRQLKAPAICLSVLRPPLYFSHKPKLLELIDRNPKTLFFLGGYGVPPQDPDLKLRNAVVWEGEENLATFSKTIADTIKKLS